MFNYTLQSIKASLLFTILIVLFANQSINAQTPVDTTKKSPGKDTIYQNLQLSFLPFIGTNGINAGKTINRVSLNVLAGYSLGTNGFEVAGIANTNKGYVRGFQAAGFSNVVGGEVSGFQAAGFTNVVKGNVRGFQSAGFLNVAGGNVQGFQAAGFANVTKGNVQGMQAAGFVNVNGDTTTGATFAGYINVCKVHSAGIMAAGTINYAHYKKDGLQVAGLFNYADTLSRSAQIAGLFNFNRKSATTTQIAGLFNYTKDLKGLQLAPFNFADTVSKGVPIGFFSFVRTGVHQLELSFDELLFLNASFRTGTRQFHNIFTAGIDVTGGENLMWTFGYGAGTTAKLSQRFNLDVDITANHINRGSFSDNVNLLNKLYIGLEFAATPKIKIAAGPVLNMFLADTKASGYAGVSSFAPYQIYNHTFNNDFNLKGWIGGKVAIRFL